MGDDDVSKEGLIKELAEIDRSMGRQEREAKRLLREAYEALEQSVKLQAHYAALLNDYDGGKRKQFASAQEWIDHLASLKG